MGFKKKSVQDVKIKHIAFIMDGNGRWAKKRALPREYGHRKGAESFRRVMEYCGELGISATTFYVFSTENWKRPKNEVDALMKLLDDYLDECKETVMKKDDGIRFVFIGDKAIFTPNLRQKMSDCGVSNRDIANLLGVDISVIDEKMRGYLPWYLHEAVRICTFLKTSDAEDLFVQLDSNT